jgi:hypothetical protein
MPSAVQDYPDRINPYKLGNKELDYDEVEQTQGFTVASFRKLFTKL